MLIIPERICFLADSSPREFIVFVLFLFVLYKRLNRILDQNLTFIESFSS